MRLERKGTRAEGDWIHLEAMRLEPKLRQHEEQALPTQEGEERSRSTIRVLTLTHHMGEGEAMQRRL
uniref:Uncharacterized protein n=1 Tax=Picea glauca TaxID=3330 RepID=A0A101LWU5_PICGL|nr:hypothetical protein ABT39_MTgene6242 [Picea glauca]